MQPRIKKFFKIFFWIIFCIGLVIGIFYLTHNHLIIPKDDQSLEANITYYILGIVTTLLLIYLAYTKIDEANKQSRVNYLIRIDERWASSEIIRAREVIHQLYLDAKEIPPTDKSKKEIRAIIGQGIKYLHRNKEKIEEFIKLLNFLDFLETIGYLHYAKAITVLEVTELLGNSIVYYFEIFKPFIDFRREDTCDYKFYEHFEILYKEVKKYKKLTYTNSIR